MVAGAHGDRGDATAVGETSNRRERAARARYGLASEPDQRLVQKTGDGSEAAYSELVMRHSDRHLAFAERVLGDRAEAEDAVQEAFVKLWSHAETFDPSAAKFTTWFYRIVLNQCLDRKRKKKPDRLPEGYDGVDERENPARAYEKAEAATYLKEKLHELPERQRYAITLCYYEGLSNKEAAAVLGVGIKALESLLTRGRNGLKGILDERIMEHLKDR